MTSFVNVGLCHMVAGSLGSKACGRVVDLLSLTENHDRRSSEVGTRQCCSRAVQHSAGTTDSRCPVLWSISPLNDEDLKIYEMISRIQILQSTTAAISIEWWLQTPELAPGT